MSIKKLVSSCEAWEPKNEAEVLVKCGVSLRHLASGAFRHVYEVDGLPLVLKVPTEFPKSLRHAQRELKVYRRCTRWPKKYAAVQSYLPRIYYSDPKSGLILMKRYKVLTYNDGNEARCLKIADSISPCFGISSDDWDSWPQNFGKDERGKIVLLDLGCLEPTSDFAGN